MMWDLEDAAQELCKRCPSVSIVTRGVPHTTIPRRVLERVVSPFLPSTTLRGHVTAWRLDTSPKEHQVTPELLTRLLQLYAPKAGAVKTVALNHVDVDLSAGPSGNTMHRFLSGVETLCVRSVVMSPVFLEALRPRRSTNTHGAQYISASTDAANAAPLTSLPALTSLELCFELNRPVSRLEFHVYGAMADLITAACPQVRSLALVCEADYDCFMPCLVERCRRLPRFPSISSLLQAVDALLRLQVSFGHPWESPGTDADVIGVLVAALECESHEFFLKKASASKFTKASVMPLLRQFYYANDTTVAPIRSRTTSLCQVLQGVPGLHRVEHLSISESSRTVCFILDVIAHKVMLSVSMTPRTVSLSVKPGGSAHHRHVRIHGTPLGRFLRAIGSSLRQLLLKNVVLCHTNGALAEIVQHCPLLQALSLPLLQPGLMDSELCSGLFPVEDAWLCRQSDLESEEGVAAPALDTLRLPSLTSLDLSGSGASMSTLRALRVRCAAARTAEPPLAMKSITLKSTAVTRREMERCDISLSDFAPSKLTF